MRRAEREEGEDGDEQRGKERERQKTAGKKDAIRWVVKSRPKTGAPHAGFDNTVENSSAVCLPR